MALVAHVSSRPNVVSADAEIPKGQLVAFLALLLLGGGHILYTVKTSLLATMLLFATVSAIGLVLCRGTQIRLKDPALRVLGFLWMTKLGLTLFLLSAGWIPQLDPSSLMYGYDPQRYYFDAKYLIDNGWSLGIVSLNYTGILYYYGAMFYLWGHNPVIPALVNTLVTLLATLYTITFCYEIGRNRGRRDWLLAFTILVPEVLWYDVMTARESLLLALLVFALLTVGRYLGQISTVSLARVLFIVGFSSVAIAFVRTSMILPVVAGTVLMLLFVRARRTARGAQRLMLAAAAVVALVISSSVTEMAGGREFDAADAIQTATSAHENVAAIPEMWSENSVGALLMPEGVLQAILFLPPRMVLYLVAPLPNVAVSMNDLIAGSWSQWQLLLTLMSSVLNVVLLPYVLASLLFSVKNGTSNPAPLVLHISYWVTFVAIAGGNIIIHERYRVMATLLFCGCAWLGAKSCPRGLIRATAAVTYGFLGAGAAFYVAYKSGVFS